MNPRKNTVTNFGITKVLAAGLLAGTVAVSGATLITPVATAAEIVVAQDQSPVAATPVAALSATPNASGSLKIHAAPRTTVTVKPQLKAQAGKPRSKTTTRSVTTNKNGDAFVTGLNAGMRYTITSGSHRIIAIPEGPVLPATSLRVVTTEIPSQLELRWQHQLTATQGSVGYTITATPISSSAEAIVAETSATSIVLTDLDLDTRYEFAVTSHNSFSAGAPTKAVMTKSLRELTGRSGTATPMVQEPSANAIAPATPSAPAPSPSGPSTRTIYVCPDGYSEAGNKCHRTLAYTFHTEVEAKDYTYYTENYQVQVTDPGPAYAADTAQSQGTPCPWGGSLNAQGDLCLLPGTTRWENRTRTVKDSTPSGFTDNGTQWVRDIQVKDTAPAGYSDNGTAWLSVVDKVAQTVTA